MARRYIGSTDEAQSCILAAGYWRKGTKIVGRFVRFYEVNLGNDKSGTIYQFKTFKPEMLEVPMTAGKFDEKGEKVKVDKFAIGSLAGWEMALDSLRTMGFPGFNFGDYCSIECTEIQPALEHDRSDMPKFKVEVADVPL